MRHRILDPGPSQRPAAAGEGRRSIYSKDSKANDRKPITNGRHEPLLSFGHRALVHFAVSNDLAAMTTRLEGAKMHFLPFNMGDKGGAGNPPAEGGQSTTSYLWERVWDKDSWLNIIGRLMIVETKQE